LPLPRPRAERAPLSAPAGPLRQDAGADAGAPLPAGADGIDPAGATAENPLALRWSRVVPLWRWLLFMLVGGAPYQLYWYYNTWRLIAAYRRVRMRPLLRSLFVPLFIAELYSGAFGLARARGYPESPPVLPLSLAFVAFSFSPLLGGGYALLGLLTFVLLLPVAEALNFFWASVEEGQPVSRAVNPLEMGLVGLGAGLWALMLYGWTHPAPAP
jgi:hypothetical protein